MLKDNIEILKKNREAVLEEELKTKYAKPYNRLLRTIAEETTAYCKEQILSGFKVREADTDAIRAVSDVITQAKPLIKDVVFVQMDFKKLQKITQDIRADIEKITLSRATYLLITEDAVKDDVFAYPTIKNPMLGTWDYEHKKWN